VQNQLSNSQNQKILIETIFQQIAHELHTPLASLKSAAQGIKQQVSLLMAGYQAAVAHQLNVPKIAASKGELLQELGSLENKVDECNRIITMLLANISANREKKLTAVKKCSVRRIINQVLAQYSFPSCGTPEIIWDQTRDFIFYGKEILLVHVLFNLLKNALYFIHKAGKGHILIWIELAEQYNAIHFKDTGTGITPGNLSKIFEPFFTAGTNEGAGLGLAFCDITLQRLGGTITCQSQWREYTEFTLKFPKKNA
jgi:signal transduction histidine kinase